MSNFCQFNGGYFNNQDTVKYKSVADSSVASDAVGPFTVTKVLAQTITLSEGMIFALARTFPEFVFMADVPVLALSKAFMETVRTADWLEIKRVGSGWTNEES